MATVTFIWKIRGSDVFEQTFRDYSSVDEAFEDWKDCWGIDIADCEVFSFSEDTSPVYLKIKYR